MTVCAPAWLAFAVIAATTPAIALAAPANMAAVAMPGAQPIPTPIPAQPVSATSGQTAPVKLFVPASQTQDRQGMQTLRLLYDAACNYDAPYHAVLAQVRASEAVVGEVRAKLLPQVNFQTDIQRTTLGGTSRGPIVLNGAPYYSINKSYTQRDAGINVSQALYRPADRIAWDQSKRQLDVAQAQLTAAQQDLIVRLAQAYFDVLAAQDTLRYLRTLKDSVNQQLAMAQRNFQIGNANITDSREAQARLAMTVAQEIAAKNDLHVKQLALEQLVGKTGVQPRPLAEPVDLPAPDPQNANGWVTRAANAPTVQQARLMLEVAQMEVAKAKTGNQPTLDLQVSVAREQYPNGNPMGSLAGTLSPYQMTLGTIGLQLTWSLYSGGAVMERERETLALQDKAQAQLNDVLRSSAQATRAAYFNLQSGLEQVKALEAAQGASQASLQANQLGYKVGARTNIDVLDAQSQLFQSQRDLARARYDALVGLLRLKQAAGTLTPGDLAPIDALLVR